MVTGTVTPTTETTFPRPLIEDATVKLLDSLGCKNIMASEIEPIVTEHDLMNRLAVHEGFNQSKLEGWFMTREGMRIQPVDASYVSYSMLHNVRINGMAFQHTFHDSYKYIQDTTDKLLWTLEKNKNYLGGDYISEITGLTSTFNFDEVGDIYLYQSETRFDITVRITEATGRSWS